MLKLQAFLLLLLLSLYCSAQVHISGIITDEHHEPLAGVSIEVKGKGGTTSDLKGHYLVNAVQNITVQLTFSYVGFEPVERTIEVKEDVILDIEMHTSNRQLDQVVVSAGKHEQEIKRLTVSTDLIKPYVIENKLTVNMEHIMNQLPSVNVIDGQVNIRGGSGWTYGAGTRVLVLLDDLPYQSADAGQVQWKFLPVENIEQIEVIKGASSVLYGSSALNGVINIRTAPPKSSPQTQVTTFAGVYDQLPRDSTRWSPQTRWQYGFNGFHSQKIKQLDLGLSLNYLKDEGYRLGENDERFRGSFQTNYHAKKIPGLRYGVDGSIMSQKSAAFLLWESYSYGYTALDSNSTNTKALNWFLAPHMDFYALGLKHRIRTKYLYTSNDNSTTDTTTPNQSNRFWQVYGEYQAQWQLPQNLGILAFGAAGSYTESNSPLYNGYHSMENIAPYLQLDMKYKRVSLSAGTRWENFRMDQEKAQRPVIFRGGINVEVTRSTFLRSSFGQGYRFPSIAEKFISTSVGSIHIFANPDLKPESGWSFETGLKQGLKLGNWQGYADVAYFWTEYNNMVEFDFGQWSALNIFNPLSSIGFKAWNIGRTRITGLDFTLMGQGKINNVDVRLMAGYTYTNPVSLNPDYVFAKDYTGNTSYSYRSTSEDSSNTKLKYRYQHLAKADIEVQYRWFIPGISLRYNSYMTNMDNIFLSPVFGGVDRGRALNPNGDLLIDIRLGAQVTKQFKVNLVVNNITKHEQMTRPADMRPPRMFLLQLTYKIQ